MFSKTKRKLFISSLALAFAAATAISTSYAWFTVQTTAKVTQIDINVTSGRGFEIRFGGEASDSDYKQTLSIDDFNDAYPNTLKNLFLNHVSLQVDQFDSEDPNKVISDKMTTLGDTGDWVDADNSHYLEFEIFFRGRGDYNIILTQSNTYGWSNGASMSVPSIFLDAENTVSGYTGTVDDRQGFLDRTKGVVSTGEPIFAFAADAARMSLKDTTLDEGVSVYREPQIIKFTDGTKGTNQKGYGDANESDKDSNLAFIYYNYIKEKDLEFPTLNEDRYAAYFLEKAKVPSDVSGRILKLADDFNPSNSDNDFTDDTDNDVYYGRLEIRIWLEGWDADCFNAVFGDTLHINLGFEAEPEETQG